MPNYTLNIKNCKACELYINNDRTYARGSLIWIDGTLDFKKKFSTFSQTAIAFLEANKAAEAQFEVNGSLTKKEGTKDWAGKWFEDIIIIEVKLAQ